VYQSLPRLLSIWFDYAAAAPPMSPNSRASAAAAANIVHSYGVWNTTVDQMNASIGELFLGIVHLGL